MDFEAVKTWLARWTDTQAKSCRTKGILGLALAPLAVAVTTTGVYWLLRLFTHDRAYNPGDANTCLWTGLAVIPLSFIGNRVMSRRDLMEERMDGDAIDMALDRFSPRRRSEVVGLLLLWILFTGPRLVDWGIASLHKRRRWEQFDTHSCAAVLWLLVSRYKKVPFEDFQTELPWLDLAGVMPELAWIPGVLKLKGPPAGLGLTDDLRKAIRTGGEPEG